MKLVKVGNHYYLLSYKKPKLGDLIYYPESRWTTSYDEATRQATGYKVIGSTKVFKKHKNLLLLKH